MMVGKKPLNVVCVAFNGAPSTQVRGFQHSDYIDANLILWENLKIGKTTAFFPSNLILGRIGNQILRNTNQILVTIKSIPRIYKCDLVYIVKYPTIFFLQITKILKKTTVFDFDDAIWHPSILGPRKFAYILKRVNAYTCDNIYLNQKAQELNPSGIIINGLVPNIKKRVKMKNTSKKTTTFIWIGSRTTAPYVKSILKEIIEIAKSNHLVKFYFLGIKSSDLGINATAKLIFIENYNKELMEEYLSYSDIGLFPVQKDEIGLCRGIHKIRVYLSANLSVIATDTHLSRNTILSPNLGILCRTSKDWQASMEYYLNNPKQNPSAHLKSPVQNENQEISLLLTKYLSKVYQQENRKIEC